MTGFHLPEDGRAAMDARVADVAARDPNFTIYKYPVMISDEVEVLMPRSARILHVAQQPLAVGDLQVWAHIDKREPMVVRKLRIYGTGHDMPGEPGRFIGTVLFNGGALVWHVYDAGEVR